MAQNTAINMVTPVCAHPLNRGTLGWWPVMPGTSSGSRLTDIANPGPSGHHGTLTNMDNSDWVGNSRPGGFGALDFDGNDEYVEDIDAEDYIEGLTAMTIAVWIKAEAISTDFGFIIGKVPGGGDVLLTMRHDKAGFDGGGTDVMKMAFGSTSTSTSSVYETAENVHTTEWQHVVATWRANEALVVYLDGIKDVPTFSTALGSVINNLTTLRIGQGEKDSGGKGWKGLIDDVHIWNRALSAFDAHQYYQLSLQGYPGLLNRIRTPRFVAAVAGATSFVIPQRMNTLLRM